METFEKTAQATAKLLLDDGAVKVSLDKPFTWASGIKSPIYCDNRQEISRVESRNQIVQGFHYLLEDKLLATVDDKLGYQFDYLAGTATAGIPWAAFVAQRMNKPMVYVRPEPKGHGAGRQIEGVMPPDQRIILVEDLISTGGSSLKVKDVLENEGQGKVLAIVSIMNYRLQAAMEAFEKAKVECWSLTDFDVLAQEAKRTGQIAEADLVKILEFQKGPKDWAQKMGLV